MADWINFSDRLPKREDTFDGMVMTQCRSLIDGQIEERMAMWDWVPPKTPCAAETWAANGFIAWRPLKSTERTA